MSTSEFKNGEYNFTVLRYERDKHIGSDKIRPCPKAIVYLEVETPEGIFNTQTNLYLISSKRKYLFNFFCCLGLLKCGESAQMPWSKITGAHGRAKFKRTSFIGKDNQQHYAINLASYIDYNDDFFKPVTKEELIDVQIDADDFPDVIIDDVEIEKIFAEIESENEEKANDKNPTLKNDNNNVSIFDDNYDPFI